MLPFPNQPGKPHIAQSFSLASTVEVFSCPTCNETINTSMQQCAFCATPIDREAAATAAAATTRISQACNDASYLRIMLGALLPFGLSIFFPFLGLIGIVGFVFLKYAIPVMAIRWWISFGRIKTPDPDFSRARRTVILVSAADFLVLLLLHVHLFGLTL